MGKSSSAAPAPPDPYETAEAQTQQNVDTAKTQTRLNSTNQVTPYGNLTYTAGPEVNGVPQWTATQTLSPVGQEIFDSNMATQQNLADLSQEQSGRLSGLLADDFTLDNDAVEGRLMELGRKRLDPLLSDRRDELMTRLTNQGIREGSTAFDKAMARADQGENDAFNQLALTGRQQAINEAITERQAPINEIIALASGSQLQSPEYVSRPQTSVAGTDIAGMINNNYNQQMNAYNQNKKSKDALMGGLFDLGANAIMFSDRRLKRDIKKIGKADNGLDIYSYRMKSGGPVQIGFMADEVEKVNSDAVETHVSGYKMVDYEKAAA